MMPRPSEYVFEIIFAPKSFILVIFIVLFVVDVYHISSSGVYCGSQIKVSIGTI